MVGNIKHQRQFKILNDIYINNDHYVTEKLLASHFPTKSTCESVVRILRTDYVNMSYFYYVKFVLQHIQIGGFIHLHLLNDGNINGIFDKLCTIDNFLLFLETNEDETTMSNISSLPWIQSKGFKNNSIKRLVTFNAIRTLFFNVYNKLINFVE